MANKTGWDDSPSIVSALTTGLDSLANGSRAISSALDNDADASAKNLYGDLELVVRYGGGPPAAGTKVAEVYLLPTVDGTNYPEGSTSVTPQKALLVATFESRVPSTSATERLVVFGITLPPRDYKLLLVNTSGQAYHTSGNTLKIKPYKLDNNL